MSFSDTVSLLCLLRKPASYIPTGAKLIADGSELLLEILDPGIIGGLLLPVLGALPDSAIVLVSGAVGSSAEAQDQLNVGVGTLAGSTIMLLTIPWAVGLWLARTDVRHGESVDGVLTKGWHLTETGATVDNDTPTNAKIMLGTSVSYLIVQLVAFKYVVDPDKGRSVEKWCAFVGMLVCLLCLIAYCAYQVLSPEWQRKQIREARRQYTAQLFVKNMLSLANQNALKDPASESTRLLGDAAETPAEQQVDVRSVGLKWKAKAAQVKKQKEEEGDSAVTAKKSVQDEDEDDKDEGQKPHDWKPIALQAALLMTIGTALVSVFSDPMVEVISDFGVSLNIKAFYVSFVITPVCSNASELISSLVFALKKKKVNTTLVYGQLYGAATMNNTMVLGIFFALIFFRGLVWNFSAETITILTVTGLVGIIGTFTCTYRTWYGIPVILLYPGALLLVYLLEKYTPLQ